MGRDDLLVFQPAYGTALRATTRRGISWNSAKSARALQIPEGLFRPGITSRQCDVAVPRGELVGAFESKELAGETPLAADEAKKKAVGLLHLPHRRRRQ